MDDAARKHKQAATLVDSAPAPEVVPSEQGGPDLSIGTLVGEYEIERKIGAGGVGSVYLAKHPVIGKRVAVKVVSPVLAVDPVQVERFLLEARAVNEIGNRHIVDIFAFGRLPDGRPYLVMEYLEGEDLGSVLEKRRMVPIEELVPIVSQLAKGLGAAHSKGIIHRDLKPENIFLGRDDEGGLDLKLVDFGLAKLTDPSIQSRKTRTGTAMGTPQYMSPEQARGLDVDPRTDVYSLGVILYECLTGRLPFDGPSYLEVLYKHLAEAPVRPSTYVPMAPAVDALVMKCLEKDPAKRFPTVQAVATQLEELVMNMTDGAVDALWKTRKTHPSLAPAMVPPSMLPPGEPAPPERRNRGRIAALTVAGAALTGVVIVIATLSGPSGETSAHPGTDEEGLEQEDLSPGANVRSAAAAPRSSAGGPGVGAPPAAGRGTIAVGVSAPGARVTIGGTPAAIVGGIATSNQVPADTDVTVSVEAPGFMDYQATLRVASGARTELRPDLVRRQRTTGRRPRARTKTKSTGDRDGIVRPW